MSKYRTHKSTGAQACPIVADWHYSDDARSTCVLSVCQPVDKTIVSARRMAHTWALVSCKSCLKQRPKPIASTMTTTTPETSPSPPGARVAVRGQAVVVKVSEQLVLGGVRKP